MSQTPLPYYTGNPPQALKKAKLDNITLVPASLLPFKAQYMEVANRLPRNGILVCLSPTHGKIQQTLQKAITQLKMKGQLVTVLSSGQFR